jgi:hypothetical protein
MSTPDTPTASQNPATAETKCPSQPPKVSLQMRAVITIFAADPTLFDVVSPFINYVEGTVDWERLYGLDLSSSHKCAAHWAYICWRDEIPHGALPFDSILNCDADLKRAIAKALAVRWGVSR